MTKHNSKNHSDSNLIVCLLSILSVPTFIIFIFLVFVNWVFALLFLGLSAFAADFITSQITGLSSKQVNRDKRASELSTILAFSIFILMFVFCLIGAISNSQPTNPYQECLRNKERPFGISNEGHEAECRYYYLR